MGPKPIIPSIRKIGAPFVAMARDVASQAIAEVAEKVKEDFKWRIKAQQFASFMKNPLSPAYLELKHSLGRDPRVMISTGTYLQAIRVASSVEGKKTLMEIGIDPEAVTKDQDGDSTDVPVWLVILANEFGSISRGLPPRPHWGPYFSDLSFRKRYLDKQILASASRIIKRKYSRYAGSI